MTAEDHERLTESQIYAFRKDGLLVVRNLICRDELEALRTEMLHLVEHARSSPRDPDFKYREHELTGKRVPFRIEYVVDKTSSAKALLGHPYILRAVEQLQGPSFIPTWDSMVFKEEGQGADAVCKGLTRCGSGPHEVQARAPSTVCAIETSYSATFAIFWSLISAVRCRS